MANENIWSRQKRLHADRSYFLERLRADSHDMRMGVKRQDWFEAKMKSQYLTAAFDRLNQIDRELELVDDICEAVGRIDRRMEELEKQAREAGWDGTL